MNLDILSGLTANNVIEAMVDQGMYIVVLIIHMIFCCCGEDLKYPKTRREVSKRISCRNLNTEFNWTFQHCKVPLL